MHSLQDGNLIFLAPCNILFLNKSINFHIITPRRPSCDNQREKHTWKHKYVLLKWTSCIQASSCKAFWEEMRKDFGRKVCLTRDEIFLGIKHHIRTGGESSLTIVKTRKLEIRAKLEAFNTSLVHLLLARRSNILLQKHKKNLFHQDNDWYIMEHVWSGDAKNCIVDEVLVTPWKFLSSKNHLKNRMREW